jgi:hypothetical protein
MKANQLATLALRLMGIYCLVMSLSFVELFNRAIFYAATSRDSLSVSLLLATFLAPTGWLAAGISLLVFSKPLAERITSETEEENNGGVTTVSFEQAQALAFAVAGVLIFAQAVPQLIHHIFTVLFYLFGLNHGNQGLPFDQQARRTEFSTAFGGLLKAALGLWLFFRARGFANFWRSLRNFGTPKAPEG